MTDAHEFCRLTDPHTSRLYRMGMRLTHQTSSAQDLVQETLTRAWAKWHQRRPDGQVGAWLARILMNTFISAHRRQQVARAKRERFSLEQHLFDPEQIDACARPEAHWPSQDLSKTIRAALASLPRDFRAAVELVDVQGLSYAEAAAQLGCPRGTIMSRLHRARKLLRPQLCQQAQDWGLQTAVAA